MSSADIRSILERLAMVEGKTTPVSVKHGLNAQQKSVDQLPALFKPRDISPTLTKKPYQKHPMDGMLVGDSIEPKKSALEEAMQEVEEDMLSKVKRGFVDYLEQLEIKNKIDSRLVRKAKAELNIDDDPQTEAEIEEDPTQQELTVEPPTAPTQDPTLAEDDPEQEYHDYEQGVKDTTVIGGMLGLIEDDPADSELAHDIEDTEASKMVAPEQPVQTYAMEDGSMLECYGDNDNGFELRKGGRSLPSRFRSADDADMAVKIFQNRKKSQDLSQDYLEEK